jgi:hypothetical protein
MPEAAPGGAGPARGAGGAGARQLALRQVPARGAGLQQALGRRVRGRAAQQLLGQGSHGGLGLHAGRGQGLAQAGLQQRQRAGAPGQGLGAAVRAAADQQLRALGLAGEVELQLARLGAALGHDARHRPAGGVQRLQVRGQPAAVAHGHPGGAARAGVGASAKCSCSGSSSSCSSSRPARVARSRGERGPTPRGSCTRCQDSWVAGNTATTSTPRPAAGSRSAAAVPCALRCWPSADVAQA